MSDDGKVRGRCPDDDIKDFKTIVSFGGWEFEADGPEIAGINAMLSAITTLGACMNSGVKPDYLHRVILGVLSRTLSADDEHVLCPLLCVVEGILGINSGELRVTWNPVRKMFAFWDDEVDEADEGEPEPPQKGDGGGIFGDLT